jgi:acyl-CoA synthetase (AMP-forming)/AMP-acid ligase II
VDTWLLLTMAAEGYGSRVAFGAAPGGLTYEVLADRAGRVGAVVRETGAERVALLDENSDLLPTLLFGAAAAGVPFAPLNYRLADDRLRAVATRLAPALVVGPAASTERLADVPGLGTITPEELAARLAEQEPVAPDVDPEGVAVLLFTSGTTGDPKAALLRHRHLASYVVSTVEYAGAAEDEAALVSVPPYHVAAVAAVLSNVYSGRRVVYLQRFEPKEWVDTVREDRVTTAMVVPTMLGGILDVVEHDGQGLPSLRNLSYGGGRMPLPTIERAMRLLPGVGFVNAYGLTETSSTIALLGPEDHRAAFASDDPDVRARLSSVGRPLPGLELEIRGEDGAPLATGESGEICVRGDSVAGEYHSGSVLTEDGWFRTNDGGHVDAEGYLFVEGRLDDVIVRGGENMSPGEIEDVVLTHPAVADVGVSGVADDEWGEVVGVAVVLAEGRTAGADEIREWVRERLRGSRVPAVVEFWAELPYLPTGKLVRREVRVGLTAAKAASEQAEVGAQMTRRRPVEAGTTVHSTSLGRAVRVGAWHEQVVPTSILAQEHIAAGRFAEAGELAAFYVDEARHIFGFMTDCARRAREYLLGRGVDEADLAEAEKRIEALLDLPDGYDPDALLARVARASEEAVRRCAAGAPGPATEGIDDLVDTWRGCHDRIVDKLCGLINEVLSRFGEAAVGEMHRAIFKPAIFDVRYAGDYEYSERQWAEAFDDLVYLACEAMRAHLGGPTREGTMELEETEDVVRMRFAPCGSGGRTLQRDPVSLAPPRADPPFNWPLLQEAHDFTWGKKGICAYCAHCCVVMEQLSIEKFGYPMRVVDPPDVQADGDVTCTWTMYKDPWSVPDEVYHRIGEVKPERPS